MWLNASSFDLDARSWSQIYDLVEALGVFFADQSSNVFSCLFSICFPPILVCHLYFPVSAVCVMYTASSPVVQGGLHR